MSVGVCYTAVVKPPIDYRIVPGSFPNPVVSVEVCYTAVVKPPVDYRIVPGSFPNPVVSVGVCYTAVDAAAGGLTTAV